VTTCFVRRGSECALTVLPFFWWGKFSGVRQSAMVLFGEGCRRRGEVFVCVPFRFVLFLRVTLLNLSYLATPTPSRHTNAFSRTTMISSSRIRSTVNWFIVMRWFQPN
jgi:hypothetical protein